MAYADIRETGLQLERQRETLQQLRNEVAALDEWTIACNGTQGQSVQWSSDVQSSRSQSQQQEKDCSNSENSQVSEAAGCCSVFEARLEESEEKAATLTCKHFEAKAYFSRCEALRAQAQKELRCALAHGAAVEDREERRLLAKREELEQLKHEESRHAATHRLDQDKWRQRQRTLRMRLRQADQGYREAAQEDAATQESRQAKKKCSSPVAVVRAEVEKTVEGIRGQAKDRFALHTTVLKATSNAADESSDADLQSPKGSKCQMGKSTSERSRRSSASSEFHRDLASSQAKCRTANNEVLQLSEVHRALLERQEALAESEESLRLSAGLSVRDVEQLKKRSTLRAEEASSQKQQANSRRQLGEVENEVNALKKEAAQLHRRQDEVLRELREHDIQGHSNGIAELQGPGADEYHELSQSHLAEWLMADIEGKYINNVKSRLSEIVADASTRGQMLEVAAAEVQLDLDRRAAIILELIERQEGYEHSSSVSTMNRLSSDASLAENTESSGSLHASQLNGAMQMEIASGGRGKVFCEAEGDPEQHELDRLAVDEELHHQRQLFRVYHEQLNSIEQQLAALLSHAGRRAHALQAWVSTRESEWQERHQTGAMAGAGSKALVLEVEAAAASKHANDRVAADTASLVRRREGLRKRFREAADAEQKLAPQLALVNIAVNHLQRPRVDRLLQQMKASKLKERGEKKVDSSRRIGGLRQELQEARDIVEARLAPEVEEMERLAREGVEVTSKIKEVVAELEHEVEAQEQAHLDFSEVKAERTLMYRYGEIEATRRIKSPRLASQLFSPSSGERSSQESQTSPHPPNSPRGKRRAKIVEDVNAAFEQLQRCNQISEADEAGRREGFQRIEKDVEIAQQHLERERVKLRSLSAKALSHYHEEQESCCYAQKRCEVAQAASSSAGKDLCDARFAVQRARQFYDSNALFSFGHTLSHVTENEGDCASSCDTLPSRLLVAPQVARGATALAGTVPETDLSAAAAAYEKEHPGLQSFLSQVAALLEGRSLEVFRKPRQRYETRQLILSSDLQRLELRKPVTSKLGSRSSFAESFIRVGCLERIHVTKAAVAAVQQAMEFSPSASSKVAPRNVRTVLRHDFPFELIVSGAEPWRFMTTEAHIFEVTTAAINALISWRSVLPGYAATLGYPASCG